MPTPTYHELPLQCSSSFVHKKSPYDYAFDSFLCSFVQFYLSISIVHFLIFFPYLLFSLFDINGKMILLGTGSHWIHAYNFLFFLLLAAISTIMSQIIPFCVRYIEMCDSALSQLFSIFDVVHVVINDVSVSSCLGFCTQGSLMDVIKSSCGRAYFQSSTCMVIRWYGW